MKIIPGEKSTTFEVSEWICAHPSIYIFLRFSLELVDGFLSPMLLVKERRKNFIRG